MQLDSIDFAVDPLPNLHDVLEQKEGNAVWARLS
jgi:hypothetical protein